MIVMAILAIAAGVVGFNLINMIKEQKFRTGVSVVTDHLQTAQEIMLVLSTPVKVVIQKNKDQTISLTTKVDIPLNTPLAKYIKSSNKIDGINSMSFNDGQASRRDEIEIMFYPSGRRMTRGVLLLSAYTSPTTTGPLRQYIPLPGFPAPIQLGGDLPKEENLFEESEALYPKELRDEYLQKQSKVKPTQNPT